MASVTQFIEQRLRLKVNTDKSAVARPEERHFLGFRLRRDPQSGEVEVLLSKRSQDRGGEVPGEVGGGASRTGRCENPGGASRTSRTSKISPSTSHASFSI
jgi:hypothetical protein